MRKQLVAEVRFYLKRVPPRSFWFLRVKFKKPIYIFADVAESADALDSGSSGSNALWVQVPSSAPKYGERRCRSPYFL